MLGLPSLQWRPKPYSAGDIDGEGSKRLLGKPDMDLPNLLMRETAQNTWDARLPGKIPQFNVHLRTLTGQASDVLNWNILPGEATSLGLKEVLSSGSVRVLEISDRNTKGLAGPTRNDRKTEGVPTDFIDFVLSVGAPRDVHLGGGTYGFGKTASYLASSCGTMVIWTRTKAQTGELEHRLIGSAIGPSFNINRHRYTGRHWWATPNSHAGWSGASVQPIVGDQAADMARHVFSTDFTGDDTGTSLLIIDPIAEGSDEELVESWRAAIIRNLWPKLLDTQPDKRKMSIRLSHESKEIPIFKDFEKRVVAVKGKALKAVRMVQAQDEAAPDDSVLIVPIASQRPKRLLGHVGLVRVLPPSQDPKSDGSNRITYMRHEAELVVKTDLETQTDPGTPGWVGVFKPVSDVDDVFARSEPAAHDSWNPEGLTDRWEKTYVRVAIRDIQKAVKDYVTPKPSNPAHDGQSPTGLLSNSLAGLTGSAPGARVVPEPQRNRPHSTRQVRPKVEVLAAEPLTRSAEERSLGLQSAQVRLKVVGGDEVTIRTGSLAIAVEGSRDSSSDGSIRVTQWTSGDRAEPGESFSARNGDEVLVDLQFPEGLAIDCSFVCKPKVSP